ncbi:hypothetical protein K456DRAFT_34514 [Colletotrichum gloeosporioides 23]|nr:hypothetical protein K456DRAFT_34514 [Colletotrichum gloeosporioides 23]
MEDPLSYKASSLKDKTCKSAFVSVQSAKVPSQALSILFRLCVFFLPPKMLPTYIFMTLLFTFGAFGKCLRDAYLPGSYSWRNRNVNIDSVCAEFSGDFSPNQFKTKCVEDKSGRRWDFELKFIGTGQKSRHISEKECMGGMESEAIKCRNGGYTKYTNWEYKVVPGQRWPEKEVGCKG